MHASRIGQSAPGPWVPPPAPGAAHDPGCARPWIWRTFDLSEVCHEAAEAVRPLALEPGVALTAAFSGTLGDVTGDREALRRMIFNLLLNACQNTDRGAITLRASRLAGRPGRVRLDVADTGRGIDPDVLPRLGYPFATSGGPPRLRPPGVGLGLWISRRIADAHGGWIEAVTQRGMGTRFTVPIRIDLPGPRTGREPPEIAILDGELLSPPPGPRPA